MRIIKRIVLVLGSLVLLAIVLLIIGSFTTPSYDALDKEAVVIIDEVVPLLADTTFENVASHFHPEFQQVVGKEKTGKLFSQYKKLGPYQSHKPFVRGNCSYKAGSESYSQCVYTVEVVYDSLATVTLTMTKFNDKKTYINRILVESEVFLD